MDSVIAWMEPVTIWLLAKIDRPLETWWLWAINLGPPLVWFLSRFDWSEPEPPPKLVASGEHGTARWAEWDDLRRVGIVTDNGRGHPAGYLLGWMPGDIAIRHVSDAHLITVAPSRSGKGRCVILPNLMVHAGSMFVIDPKGENAAITAAHRARAMGHRVICLNPWRLHGQAPWSLPAHRFNPLAEIDIRDINHVDDVDLLADMLVMRRGGGGEDSHFDDKARSLIGTILLWMLHEEPVERQTLPWLRRHLMLDPEGWAALLGTMAGSEAAGGLVREGASAFLTNLTNSPREAGSVLSTAQRHTEFLRGPAMDAALSGSDFRMNDLNTGATTIYVIIPAERLGTHGGWLRLVTGFALRPKLRRPGGPRVLFLMDEFAALGTMRNIETGMGGYAGFGIIFWPFLQDLAQLRDLYGKGWQTFMSNAQTWQFFGTRDVETARYVSDAIGQQTIVSSTYNASQGSSTSTGGGGQFGAGTTGTSTNESWGLNIIGRPLLRPEEVTRLAAGEQVILMRDVPPVWCLLRGYDWLFADDPAAYLPNPFHGPPPGPGPQPGRARL